MEKKIYVSDKAKTQLRKTFDCSKMMVWLALNFKRESDLARKIRYTALTQFGGVPNWNPAEMETTHEEVEKTMTLRYGGRVKLVYDRNDGSAHVLIDGKEERVEHGVDVPGFMVLQNEVEMMAMSL